MRIISQLLGSSNEPDFYANEPQIDDRTVDTLWELIYQGDGLNRIELHGLTFLSNVYFVENDLEQLDAEWEPDYHGVSSEDVDTALQSEDLAGDPDMEGEGITFDNNLLFEFNTDVKKQVKPEIESAAHTVLDETDYYVERELQANTASGVPGFFDILFPRYDERYVDKNGDGWLQNHPAREATGFGEKVDFERYRRGINYNAITPTFSSE